MASDKASCSPDGITSFSLSSNKPDCLPQPPLFKNTLPSCFKDTPIFLPSLVLTNISDDVFNLGSTPIAVLPSGVSQATSLISFTPIFSSIAFNVDIEAFTHFVFK